jgi:Protein of unknown function (DUF2975)
MSRSNKWLRAASVCFLVLIPLLAAAAIAGIVVYWGFGIDRWGNATLGQNFIVLTDRPPVPERQVFGLLASLPALVLWLYAMARLFVMFRSVGAGKVMALDTIRHLRAFALFSALSVVAGFALSGVMRWAIGEFDDQPLWTHLGFSVTHASVLFTSAIIFVASHIIQEGLEYKNEVEEYV